MGMNKMGRKFATLYVFLVSLTCSVVAASGGGQNQAALARVRARLLPQLRSLGLYPVDARQPMRHPLDGSFYYKYHDRYLSVQRPVKKYVVTNKKQRQGKWVSGGTRTIQGRVNTIHIRFQTAYQIKSRATAKQQAVRHNQRYSKQQSTTAWEARGGGQLWITPLYFSLVGIAKDKVYAGLPGDMFLVQQQGKTTAKSGLREGPRPYKVVDKRKGGRRGFMAGVYSTAFSKQIDINRPYQIIAFAEYKGNDPTNHFGFTVSTILPKTELLQEVAVPGEGLIDKIMRIIAQIVQQELGKGNTVHVKLSNCFTQKELTKYINGLNTHKRELSQIDLEADRLLKGADPDRETLIRFGKKAYTVSTAFLETFRAFNRGNTRRGTLTEFNLLLDNSLLVNHIASKYRELARVPAKPVDQNGLKTINQKLSSTLFKLVRERVAKRLESEGLREILTSDSWNEAVDKAMYHVRRKVKQQLERETEKIFGIGFYDARSAHRALRLQMRREVRRQVAKLLVKITSNQIIINFVAAPVIRWLERNLWPKIREGLRPKGDLINRTNRSIGTLNKARNNLNSLQCDARLRDVRQVLAKAEGTINATKYLDRDLRRANNARELSRIGDASGNLRRTMSMTYKRFLLHKEDALEELEAMISVTQGSLRDLKDAIPGGNTGVDDKDKAKAKRIYQQAITHNRNKNYAKAFQLFQQSAELGNGNAMINIGLMYEYGRGVGKDYRNAAKWYRKAAEQGSAVAQSNLAKAYYYGRGVSKNLGEAAKWFKMSADQGFDRAIYYLAWMVDHGQGGLKKNPNEAVRLYRIAARRGHKNSQKELKKKNVSW